MLMKVGMPVPYRSDIFGIRKFGHKKSDKDQCDDAANELKVFFLQILNAKVI